MQRTAPHSLPSFSSMRVLQWAYAVLFASGSMFAFWLSAFLGNGSHRYSYDDTTQQYLSDAGRWPFAVTDGFPQVFLIPAVLGGLLANFAIPVAALFILNWTLTHWSDASRIQRRWCGIGLVLVLLLLVIWLWFSPSLITWLLD